MTGKAIAILQQDADERRREARKQKAAIELRASDIPVMEADWNELNLSRMKLIGENIRENTKKRMLEYFEKKLAEINE